MRGCVMVGGGGDGDDGDGDDGEVMELTWELFVLQQFIF